MACASLLLASCASPRRETLLTWFDGPHSVSVRYPASWHTEQAEQDGMWYRYFLAPASGPKQRPAASVTLFAGPLAGMPLDEYAQSYLGGNPIASRHDVERGGARGRSYLYASPDGATRSLLLVLERDDTVYGLHAQADAAPFEMHFPILEEMAQSLSVERVSDYPELRNEEFAYSLRVPASWTSTRGLARGGQLFRQYTSPAIAVDPGRGTVHASLSLTVEPAQALETFYNDSRRRLGDALRVLDHEPWRTGYADLLNVETPVATSRARRYYAVADGRGYVLACEAREDVFHRVAAWCDLIASGLTVGP